MPRLRDRPGLASGRLGPFVLGGVVLAAGVLPGCGGWRGHGNVYYAQGKLRREPREATYAFSMPGSGWKPLEVKDGQVAWINDDLGASIRLHSECAEHGDSSLEQFLDHLRIGWTNWNVESQEDIRLVDRAALRAVVSARLDGVPFRHEFVLVKKNGCLFDLTYSARPPAFEAGRPAFKRVVEGFRFPVEED